MNTDNSEGQIVLAKGSKPRDNDGLHRRRGIWHFKVKEGGRWREFSTHTINYAAVRKVRQRVLQTYEDGNFGTDRAKWNIERAIRL